MKSNPILDKDKEQPMFKAVIVMLIIIVVLIKIGELGFEFGQWLKVH